jgi:osmoprotectant transport system permease protein
VVVTSGLASLILGVGGALAVSRPSGRALLPLARNLTSVGQTFPPAAVLVLCIPALGFGPGPAWVALTVYGILPIFTNTLQALEEVPEVLRDAARGLGFSPVQVLVQVEIPLALPLILAGVRTSTVINVGTAAIGATVGAGGFGSAIISGLVTQNFGYLTEGAVLTGLLALTLDGLFARMSSAERTS